MVAVAPTRRSVCHLLHSLQVGGAEMLAARLARRFGSAYRIVFACLDGLGPLGEELRNDGFPVHVLGRNPGLDWKCVARLGTLLRRERIDLVHAHQYTPFFYALSARWLHRRPPILFLEHGRHQPDYPRRKRIVANRWLIEDRDRVLGVGEAVRRALIDNEGIPAERVGVIYNGIVLEKYNADAAQRLQVRAELGLNAEDLVLIQVARLDPIKDHDTALRAFARLVRQRPEARLLLVGDGPQRGAIEAQVKALSLEGSVCLLGTRTDVHRLLAAADMFLLTSTSEGIPLTLIEAMAAGLPVVATDVGGVGEVVQDGLTGCLAPAGDDQELAQRILRLAKETDARMNMGKAGQARAAAFFSEQQMVVHYAQLYREMLSQRACHG